MPRRKVTVSAVALFPVVALLFLVGQRSPRTVPAERPSLGAAIQATRLSPPGDPAGEIDCTSLEWIHFTYQVSNRGQVPVAGLKVGTKCACEEVDAPPDAIPPGEAGSITFRLRAPRVGRVQRTVPLLADGTSEPLALLDVALHVRFEPPALISTTDGLNLTFIKGNSSAHEVVLEAIEARHANPWIRELLFEPSEGIETGAAQVESLPEPDPDLTRRRYHFAIANRSLPVGRRMAIGNLRTAENMPAVKDPLLLSIEIVDPVAVVPDRLVIKYVRGSAPSPRRVCVIDRTGGCAFATPAEYDRRLLRVEPRGKSGGATVAFDVAPVQLPDSALETQVVFNIGSGETRELLVRFEPSERP